MRYPLALYGPKGWDDLDDVVTTRTEAEEADARSRGYRMLREMVEPVSGPETAEAEPFNVTWDMEPDPQPAPKRRGRPPKAKPKE